MRKARKRQIARKMRKAAGEGKVSDRLLELPDFVIHRIFDLMNSSKDVARMQFLSKNWKRVFHSYPEVDFNQSWFRRAEGKKEEERQRFKDYVEKSLTMLDHINSFRLHTDGDDIQLIAGWIASAMAKGARELDVTVDASQQGNELPIESTQSSLIISLNIAGGPLHRLAAMEMCNLRHMSIGRAEFLDESLMKKLEENCPLLENLRLVDCPKLMHLEISSLLKLQTVEVQSCNLIQRVKITAPDLKTFCLHGENYKSCKVEIECSGYLRKLIFKTAQRTELLQWSSMARPKIWSIGCSELGKVKSDALNLYSFQYQLPRRLIKACRLSELKFSFHRSYHAHTQDFHESKRLKLIAHSGQSMEIFDDLTGREEADLFLFRNHECKMEVTASSFEAAKIAYSWLNESHGTSLVLRSSDSFLRELIYRMVMVRERKPSCCKFHMNKCWKHYVKDVIEVSDFDEEVNTSYVFTWRSIAYVDRT